MKKRFLFALLFSSLLAGCQDENTPVPQTAREMLSAHPWVRTAVTQEKDANPTEDVFATMHPCERDDIYHFRADGTYTITEGKRDCQNYFTIGIGSWQLSDDSKSMLRVTRYSMPQGKFDHTLTVTIDALTPGHLIVSESEMTIDQELITTHTTFAAQ